MKPVTAVLVCSLIANVVAVGVLSRRSDTGAPGLGKRPVVSPVSKSGSAVGGAVGGGASGTAGSAGVAGASDIDPGAPGSNLALAAAALATQNGGLAGKLQIMARVAAADRFSIKGLLSEVSGMSDSKQRDELLAEVYQRWGQVSPNDALAAISGLPPSERDAREVDMIRGWALTDPAAAMDWMDKNPPPLSSTTVNPPNAARYQAMADALLEADRPDLLAQALASASDDAHKSLLATKLAGYLANYDPQNGLAWLMSLPAGSVRSNSAAQFARTITEDTPELGLKFATSLPANAGRNQAITAVFKQWADSGDPAPAAEWLGAQKPTAAIDNALVAFLPVAAGKDGAVAAGLLDRFANPDNRQRAVDLAATRIALVDPARAVDWEVSNSPESPDRVKKLLPLATAWMKVDPAGAANQVAIMPGLTFAERDALLAVVAPPAKK